MRTLSVYYCDAAANVMCQVATAAVESGMALARNAYGPRGGHPAPTCPAGGAPSEHTGLKQLNDNRRCPWFEERMTT